MGNPDRSVAKADEAALELMKQLITLASGVLALSAAFADKLPKVAWYWLIILSLSWVSLVGSLFFGLQTISAIVKSRLNSDTDWSKGASRTYGRLCKAGFLLGIGLFVLFAFVSLVVPSPSQNEIKITVQSDDPRIIEMIKGMKKD